MTLYKKLNYWLARHPKIFTVVGFVLVPTVPFIVLIENIASDTKDNLEQLMEELPDFYRGLPEALKAWPEHAQEACAYIRTEFNKEERTAA